jgi:4-diphosphocytidyl-2-C-methyl-D-erythritol kinase
MRTLTVAAPAKINLSLDVTGVREDGYHLLRSVMQSIDLSDYLTISLIDGPAAIKLTSEEKKLPLDSRNTCYRAAAYWLDLCGSSYSIIIDLEKNIPSEAGLGGGSSDAAAVLRALNSLSGGLLTDDELHRAALWTGADVPFCLAGGISLCEGVGEIIEPLPAMPERHLLLLKPYFGLSTPEVFKQLDKMDKSELIDHKEIIPAVRQGDWGKLGKLTGNALQQAALALRPDLAEYLEILEETASQMVMMTGSGTCCYAVYDNEAACDEAERFVADRLPTGSSLFRSKTI